MENSSRTDATRRLVQLASEYGKTLVSPQTGFLHYYTPQADVHHTIPFLDNLHLALVWFKTHIAENMQTAKTLLSALLEFVRDQQIPSYLHEYPVAKDRSLPVKALLPFALILRDYGHILGHELRTKIESLVQCQEMEDSALSPLQVLKRNCALKVLGNNAPVDAQLDWDSLAVDACAEAALAFYAVKQPLPAPLLKRLIESWHIPTQSYRGEPRFIRQNKTLPQLTLYELLMYTFQGSVPSRQDLPTTHALLQCGYLPDVCVDTISWPKMEAYAVTTLSKKEIQPSHEDYRYHILYSVWGEPQHPSTFVCQVAPHVLCEARKEGNKVEMEFSFEQPFSGLDDDSAREISFYLSYPPKEMPQCILPTGQATIFREKDCLTVTSNGMQIDLCFENLEGSGQFVGHLLAGNRPSQCGAKGAERFSAFDRQILLRTVTRDQAAKVKVTVNFSEKT